MSVCGKRRETAGAPAHSSSWWERGRVLAIVPAALLLTGCIGYSLPKPLDPSEVAFVREEEGRLTAGVRSLDRGFEGSLYDDEFLESIRELQIFRNVDHAWVLEGEPDVWLNPRRRCGLTSIGGGFVPLFPMLTFGLVPQLGRGGYHWAFEIERAGEIVFLDCPVRGTFGMGWIPWMLRVTPKWTGNPEAHPRVKRRLAHEVARGLDRLPP